MIGYGNSMFLATHGILARSASGGAVDPDAQAFITAASITDPTQQSAINQLVVDLKGYSIWTKMKALYPFVGGTSSTHKWNLKDPRDLDAAFRLVFNGGWTHSSTGATPNGTNAYADTKFNPFLLSQSLTSSHLTYYQRGISDSGTSRNKIGAAETDTVVNGFAIGFFSAGTREVGVVGSVGGAEYAPTGVSAASQGLFMINTNTNRNARHWKNGVTNGAAVSQTGSMPNYNIYLAYLNSSSPNYYGNKECSFASIGNGLTDTEAANFYTAVQAFQVTLGRSIGTQTVSDADAQAFVTNAGIVDQVEANAINNLVIGLKADSLWTKMKAVYPFVGGTSTSTSYNLVNTALYQISWSGGVTWGANGVQFGGVNGYGNTNLNLTALNKDNLHFSFYSRTNNTTQAQDMGQTAFTSGNAFSLLTHYGGALKGSGILSATGIDSIAETTYTNSTGLLIITRQNSNNVRLFRNAVKTESNTNNSVATVDSGNIFIGARNQLTIGGAANYTNRQAAFISMGDNLTDTDATNLNSRVTTFQTTLNRNV